MPGAVLLGVLLCVYPIRCQTNMLEAKIVNGKPAQIIDIPYSAFLEIACTPEPWACGASILNQQILLTAAHCLLGSTADCISVKTGNENRNKGITSIGLRYRIHKRYSVTNMSFDIGLLMLKKPLTLNRNVGRVALMPNPPYKEIGTIAGWGTLDDDGSYSSIWLQYITQEITQRLPCEQALTALPTGVICGGSVYQKSYAAGGDSGSALVVKDYIQVGLVSFKFKNISKSLVVYTDVGYYYNWINTNTELLFCGVP